MNNLTISVATVDDIPELINLVNCAYRGNEARKGWTHEADLIDGTLRTDKASMERLIINPASTILKCIDTNNVIVGCVYLEKKDSMLYLGMLSVSPEIQAKGIGKMLLAAAEDHAHKVNCKIIEMTVISVREELIAWYERRGYNSTGMTIPFPDDNRFGIPKQPIEFIVMEKKLTNAPLSH